MIRDFFIHHPWMKILALTLAVILWFFVRGERQNEKTVDVPVSYTNIPETLIYSGAPPDTIRLRLRGPQTRLAKVDRNYFHQFTVDLKEADQGINTYWIYEEDFGLPFGIYITQIYPQSLRVLLENKITKEIPVRPKFSGVLPPGIDLSEIQVIPNSVLVESHQAELDKLEYFNTEPISLANRMKDFEGEYFIDSRDVSGVIYTDKVKVSVDLLEKEISETIAQVPIVFDLKDVFLDPETVDIELKGPLTKVLRTVKSPPIPRLDPVLAEKARVEQKDQKIPLVFTGIEGLEITLNPDQVWIRFKKDFQDKVDENNAE